MCFGGIWWDIYIYTYIFRSWVRITRYNLSIMNQTCHGALVRLFKDILSAAIHLAKLRISEALPGPLTNCRPDGFFPTGGRKVWSGLGGSTTCEETPPWTVFLQKKTTKDGKNHVINRWCTFLGLDQLLFSKIGALLSHAWILFACSSVDSHGGCVWKAGVTPIIVIFKWEHVKWNEVHPQ